MLVCVVGGGMGCVHVVSVLCVCVCVCECVHACMHACVCAHACVCVCAIHSFSV